MTPWPRVLAAASVIGLGLVWLFHAGMKVYGGVGEGTLYAAWIGSHVWLHWVWCGSEAGLGLWLLSERAVRPALLASMFVLTMFSAVILLEPHAKPCGCGASRQPATRADAAEGVKWSLGRNAALMAVAVVGMIGTPGPTTPNRSRPES